MNQILVTEKLYITPELKRKKKLYKLNFFLSVFLVCVLFSYYIYAEYDRNKNEEVSKEILASINLKEETEEQKDDSTIKMEDNVLIVRLDRDASNREEIDITKLAKDAQDHMRNRQTPQQVYTTENGLEYITDSIINIPSLGINYPVLSHISQPYTTDELLKLSLTKFWGKNGPNEVGNYVVVGHNYRNKKMFGRLSEIKVGDEVEVMDLTGRTLKYSVYDRYIVAPEDTSCTSQETGGKREITLITCTNYGTQRLIVKAREIK